MFLSFVDSHFLASLREGGAHNKEFPYYSLPCVRGGGLPKARRRGCFARAVSTVTTLPPRFAGTLPYTGRAKKRAFARPLHREGKIKERRPHNDKRKAPASFLVGAFLAIGLSINQTVVNE